MKTLLNTAFRLMVPLLVVFLSIVPKDALAADVCSQGVGIPPFLTAGADPNLLLLLDNSGSMLDMAYTKAATQCFDDSYDPAKTYAGYFEKDSWYVWETGTRAWNDTLKNLTTDPWVAPWKQGVSYLEGQIVYANGGLYKAYTSGMSNDAKPRDGYNLSDDTGVVWDEVSQAPTVTALTANCSTADQTISYQNSVYICKSSVWQRLEGGQFLKQEQSAAATVCANATGNKYSNNDLCITVENASLPAAPPLPAVTVNKAMNAFAARGNFLNWAAASKFDVQKKILTGGKYDPDTSQLVGESRGCAGYGYVKQVTVGTMKLVMRVRGADNDDRVGDLPKNENTDDTTRIEIIGINATGFNQGECQDVINKLITNPDTLSQNDIDQCLSATNEVGTSQAALSTSVNVCRQLKDDNNNGTIEISEVPNLVSTVAGKCEDLFKNYGYSPATMSPADGGYVCYGIYDSSISNDADRVGYLGRCWNSGSGSDAVCIPKPEVSNASGGCDRSTDLRCLYCAGGADTTSNCPTPNIFKNEGGYNYQCKDIKGNASQGYYCKTNDTPSDWNLLYVDNDNAACTPAAPATGGWDPALSTVTKTSDCINRAMIAFCGSLKVPEVIDPSDQATTTTDYWNTPAMLIDGGVLGQMGVEKPLAVMKGLIRYELPAEQTSDAVTRPDGPRGVLFDVAGDIRLGIMALNANGAKTECTEPSPSPSIIKYCPADNKDGAQVITQIQEGMFIDNKATPLDFSDDVENWDHYKKLVTSINTTRGTAWTPLAEAMYSALAYYGQNKIPRLSPTDFYYGTEMDSEGKIWDDPVKYWCQDNHVLVITEGASTADVNTVVSEFAKLNGETTETNETVCMDGLKGSPYLDNLTWFGQKATVEGATAGSSTLFSTLLPTGKTAPDPAYEKQPVTTHIVSTGSLRTDGTGECSPATLMLNAASNGGTTLLTGEDPAQLESNLKAALSDILGRASAGSAASVISSSRSGEGGVYQAIFWPQLKRPIGEKSLAWVGDVHAFYIDEKGFLWDDYSSGGIPDGKLWSEDKNGNGVLDVGEDINGNGKLDGDRRVITFYNTMSNTTQVCFNSSVVDTGVCVASDYIGTSTVAYELRDFDAYVWSANKRLQTITDDDIVLNRGTTSGAWDFTSNHRYIFTWNDLNNDGIVDSDEQLPFVAGAINTGANISKVTAATDPRSPIVDDFNMSTTTLDPFVNWIRGEESTYYRCRRYPSCATNSTDPVWRLGDVIHSTPTLVARPAEGYQYLYGDPDYALFYKKYLGRRHVVYFGANDGMLHAVNAGFYLDGANKFLPCREDQRDSDDKTKCANTTPYGSNGYPALGDELWAFIPYNLQKHLSCTADPNYFERHKYFVDAPPRVFDARIFPDDADHPKGWGTILVGSMRFGGAPIAGDTDVGQVNREFVSSYFILDITNPEKPPRLLAEMTMNNEKDPSGKFKFVDLGYTTSMPTMAIMRGDNGGSEWYLILGNGPTELTGENSKQGRVAVVPLSSLSSLTGSWATNLFVPTTVAPLRIPNIELSGSAEKFGIFTVPPDSNDGIASFISDMITVDFDIKGKMTPGVGVPYKSDVIYFGTTDGTSFSGTNWNGGGRMFRLLMNELDADGKQIVTVPKDWKLELLIDAKAPITAAPNVSYDGDNFWVYFGTGRFYDAKDKKDTTQQYFFGLKEPKGTDCKMNWEPINWWSGTAPIVPAPANDPGAQGLKRTDGIQIEKGDKETLTTLEKYIVGERCGSTPDTGIGVDGWYRNLTDLRERSLGMPTLLGGLTTFTTYQPSADLCTAEGSSYLYAVYGLTGTAWYQDVIGTDTIDGKEIVRARLGLGKGLATTPSLQVGAGDGATAYIQTSTGEIVKVEQEELPFENVKSGRQSWQNK